MTATVPVVLLHSARKRTMSQEKYWGVRFLALVLVCYAAAMVLGFQTGVTLLTVAGILAALAGFARPTVGLFGVGILCVLDSVTRVLLLTGGLFRYNTFNYILLLMMALSIPVVLKLGDLSTRLLMGLAFLMTLGLALSPDVAAGSFGLLNLAAEFGLLVFFVRAKQEGNTLYWMGLVNATVSSVGCTIFFMQMSSIRFINPNAWSYMPVTGLFSVCLAYSSATSLRERLPLLLLSAFNCGCVFLSASRGSMLVATICVAYLLFATKSTVVRVAFLGGGAALVVIVTTLFSDMSSYALRRVNKLFDDRYALAGKTSGRSELAAAGIQMFVSNPFGRGTGAFEKELSDVEGFAKQSHSGWIKSMVENGLVGVLLLASFVGSFAILGWKLRERSGALALGFLVTAALGSAFFSTEFNAKGLWFLASGATAVLSYPGRSRQFVSIPDTRHARGGRYR